MKQLIGVYLFLCLAASSLTAQNTRIVAEIKIGNMFRVNEAKMGSANTILFENQISNLISKYSLSVDSFRVLASSIYRFKISSDERTTYDWGGSNENLNNARIGEVVPIFTNVVKTFNYPNYLPASLVSRFKDTKFIIETPVGGITYLTDIINDTTGMKFTNAEIAELSAQEKEELYDMARYVNVVIEAPVDSLIPVVIKEEIIVEKVENSKPVENKPKKVAIDTLAPVIPGLLTGSLRNETVRISAFSEKSDNVEENVHSFIEMNPSQKVTVFLDNSSSMFINHRRDIKTALRLLKRNYKDVLIVTYSNGFEYSAYFNLNKNRIPRIVRKKNFEGSGDEQAIRCLWNFIEKRQGATEPIIAVTDEGLQDLKVPYVDQMKLRIDTKKTNPYVLLLREATLPPREAQKQSILTSLEYILMLYRADLGQGNAAIYGREAHNREGRVTFERPE